MLQLRETTMSAPGIVPRYPETRIGAFDFYAATCTEPLWCGSADGQRACGDSWPGVTEDLFLFSQEDPIPARLRYGYGRNAPLTYADPSGLAVWVFNAFSEGDYDAQLERSISAQLCRVGVGYLRAGEFRPGDIPRLVGPGDDVIVLGHSVGLADDTGDMLVGDGDIFNQENYFFLGGHGVNLRVKSLSLVGCHTDRIVDFPSLYQIPGAVVLGDEDTVRLLSFAAKLAIALQRDPNMPISDLVTSALTGANRDPFIDPSVPPMSARAR